ncbi:type VI secretion system protein TssR domain-containing protein [Tenacibaculum maritimum]|uniref:type VI secretion system protein TssR domain-containing protein n=1 Tax=Tenacibaculum maritimum TaxID=107401 RepID=UPI0012E4517F|nr:type VI secretion system protein TssR domain-containing protein [Tenacibaculum maritimum]MCD9564168.1 hypothetical protein [Tenacibaculum maritimum]MCD9566984.1 hypothetical protein [Tenacibaculum maritimum]MCD9580235.1 hypothetical protein [Tenacibaculum maritimum]MCD9597934.1 hypothetical protein [Tenacibaculum maritimum]MCD9614884.1 hypothetical protein [Tenacibaculum maritimum]
MSGILKKIVIVFFTIFFLFIFQNSFGQLSKYEKVEKIGEGRFNYIKSKLEKDAFEADKDVRIVYSDREANEAYLDPYGQQKNKKQKFLTPYFIIDAENGAYELVVADASLIGKPKGLFSVFMGKKYRFSDTKGLVYAGWIPKERLLNYTTSIIDEANNKALKYKIGISRPKTLFKLHRFFKKDTLSIYKDPVLKIKSDKKLFINQTVYPYKYNETQKAVFVSTKPQMKDTISQISGWIPADFITPIGQNEVFKLKDNFYFQLITKKGDTINLEQDDFNSKYFYHNTANQFVSTDSIVDVNIPLYVWNHKKNKLINVKGNDVLVSEARRLAKESKMVNFHFIFDETDRYKIKPLINSLQNIWIFLSQYPEIELSFSVTCTGRKRSFLLPKTKSFPKWLDFLQEVVDTPGRLKEYGRLGVKEAVNDILLEKDQKGKNFENNFFIIVGSKGRASLNNYPEVIRKLSVKSAKLLFVQLENNIQDDYQNYLLNAKETMSETGEGYNVFIENFIVDNSLIVGHNSLKNIPSETDNIYIYDAPKNSLFNGGIIFPKINEKLSIASLDIAVDSILTNTYKTNQKLISSLKHYESKLGILRSKPSVVVTKVFEAEQKGESLDISEIDRNNINEVYYHKVRVNDTVMKPFEKGYILTKEELLTLIEEYRMLLPRFKKKITKKNRKILQKMYELQIDGINQKFKRMILDRRNTMAKLFYSKTSIPVTEHKLYEIKIKHLKSSKTAKKGFSKLYFKLIKKVDVLEEMLSNNKLEKATDNSYYIPKKMMI